MTFLHRLCWVLALSAAPQVASGEIILQFDYSRDTGGFFTPTRRAVLEAAGLEISSRLEDTLDAITPGGGNSWNATFTNPTTGASDSFTNPTIAADTIVIVVGARNLGSTLGVGGFGGFSASGNTAFFDNILSRGEAGITNGSGAPLATQTDFAPWGGSISFNSSASWHFDTVTNPPGGVNDFYSVALHEIGHVLGLGTANSWDSLINVSNQFTGPAATSANGGSVPLNAGGDHWASGTMSTLPLGGIQEAAMDPELLVGSKKFFTVLDFAALDDIGWEVAAIPEPSTYLMVTVGIVGLVYLRRGRRVQWASVCESSPSTSSPESSPA